MVFWFSSITQIQIHFFQSKPNFTLHVNCAPNVGFKKQMVQVGMVLGSMAERAMTKRQQKSNLTEEIMVDSAVVEYTKKIASTIEQKKVTRFYKIHPSL